MSDFLSRLAARTLGRAPVARPRLPTRFEPVEGLAAGLVAGNEPERERAVPGLEALPAAARPPTREALLPAVGDRSGQRTPPPIAPRVEPFHLSRSTSLRSTSLRSTPPALTPSAAPPSVMRDPLPAVASTPDAARPIPPTARPETPSAAVRPAPEPAAVHAQLQTERDPTEPGRIEPEVIRTLRQGLPAGPVPRLDIPMDRESPGDGRRHVGSESSVEVRSSNPPAFELPAFLSEPARGTPPAPRLGNDTAAADAEPTVKVTIGRIEVRAAAPPVPKARPRRAPAPRMALGDYLDKRRGGHR